MRSCEPAVLEVRILCAQHLPKPGEERIAPELGGRALSAAPGLLLCDPEDVAAARQEMEFARGTEKARETIAVAPGELLKAVEMLVADEVGAEAWR